MKKVDVKKTKKKVCSLLAVGLVVCSISVSASGTLAFAQEKASEIKVLKNQQQEINDVLSIKNIAQLPNIVDIFWMDDKQLLCVENINGVENLLVYNADTTKTTRLTDIKEKYNARFFIAGSDKDISYSNNKYMVYQEAQSHSHKKSLYSLNTKDFSITKIEDDIRNVSRVSNDKVVYQKDKRLTLVDLPTGEKKEIQLPKDLYQKLDSPFCTFEEFMAADVAIWGEPDDEHKEFLKEHYNFVMSDFLEKIDLKDNKLLLKDAYDLPEEPLGMDYIFDLKTNTYINAADSDHFATVDPKRIEVGPMTLSGMKLWELNEKGERIKLIDEGMLSVNTITLSEDGSKLIYAIQQNGTSNAYIYDFNSGKKVVLHLETNSRIFWNESSNRVAYKNYIFEGDNCVSEVVNVITIN